MPVFKTLLFCSRSAFQCQKLPLLYTKDEARLSWVCNARACVFLQFRPTSEPLGHPTVHHGGSEQTRPSVPLRDSFKVLFPFCEETTSRQCEFLLAEDVRKTKTLSCSCVGETSSVRIQNKYRKVPVVGSMPIRSRHLCALNNKGSVHHPR